MRWSDYQAWHRANKPRQRVEATMTDVMPTTPPARPVKAGPTRDQLWPELVTAAGSWRKHYHRCPPGQRCRREHMEWIDLLLDEWLEATH